MSPAIPLYGTFHGAATCVKKTVALKDILCCQRLCQDVEAENKCAVYHGKFGAANILLVATALCGVTCTYDM